ncbi:Alpha/beta hydrolase family protein [Reichenbachiella faecimaris]|uniref:Alpha/beta hydrolase family protein n=1 Tax=Reichenbachiella faecimaris TaxID=692418 RepID=A0A1W2G921_REIFA|nr:alpha/beta hydrolase [Reichenbachiella faecimaris]SMD33091.1 Alpha/beta hydrolase family protein [Reichenbachiella faecimaris]
MKVYCLSGLGADTSVFELLKINNPKVYVEWIPSFQWESMTAYARRLCDQVDDSEPFVLLGVSFGGMLAVEMNKYIQPQKTILVTSLARTSELPLWIRWIAKTRLNRIIPSFLFGSNPKWLIWYFGIKSEQGKKMVTAIAKKTDRAFTKLCIDKVLSWRNERLPENLIRIHATKDLLLPAPKGIKGIDLEGAGHFAIVENASEISVIVEGILSEAN